MDTRYEVRDAQLFAGMLVDEGIARKRAIASAGGSYGGGLSMALAALKNRTMLEDDSLVPWESPEGRRISLAAADSRDSLDRPCKFAPSRTAGRSTTSPMLHIWARTARRPSE